MSKKKKQAESIIPIERIENKILLFRDTKVMIDQDLAELYEVETAQLKRAVRRNIERFPEDFMFQLTKEEYREFLRCQFGILEKGAYPKYPPFAFTEYGILMLSSVLNSERAIQVNIQIMRAFAKMKNIILDRLDYDDLSKSLENFELRHQLEIHEIHEI